MYLKVYQIYKKKKNFSYFSEIQKLLFVQALIIKLIFIPLYGIWWIDIDQLIKIIYDTIIL